MTSAAPITPIIANEAPTPITEPHPPEDFPPVVVSVPEVLSGDVADVVSVGDEVEAKITEIDYDNKKVSLSIRALLPEEPVVEETVEEEDKISEEDIPEGVSVETAE